MYYLAVAAMMVFAMVACGNAPKQEEGTEEQAVVEQVVEQPAEAAAVEEKPQLPVGPCTVELDMFSVDLPEGWKVLKQESHDLKIYPGTGDEFDESILIQEQPYRSMTEAIETFKGLVQTKDLGTQTYGTNKFVGFESPGGLTVLMKANDKDEYIQAEVRSAAYKNEAYKQILGSIKLK